MIFDLLSYFIFKIGASKSASVIFSSSSVCGRCKILKTFLICSWKNVTVNWLSSCETLTCAKQLVIHLSLFCVRLQLPHFIILAVKDPSATFLWHCKHERYFPNVSRPMTSTLASVVVKESGSSTDWGKDSMKSYASETVQSCIVVPKASLSDLYSFITLTLWNV